MDIEKIKSNKALNKMLRIVLVDEVTDTFEGHQGRPGKVGGSVARLGNAKIEVSGGVSIRKIKQMAKEQTYTKELHKQLQDNALVLVGKKLYQWDAKQKIFKSNYGANNTLKVKDLIGQQARVFMPTGKEDPMPIEKMVVWKRIKRARVISQKLGADIENWARVVQNGGALKANEEKALVTYTDSKKFKNINNGLKKGKVSATAKTLTSALERSTFKTDIMLFRKTGLSGLAGLLGMTKGDITPNNIKELEGKIGTNKCFMSLANRKVDIYNDSKVEMEVFCPAGTKGRYIGKYVTGDKSGDVLLQRDTKFAIKKAEYKNGKYHVQLEVVPDKSKKSNPSSKAKTVEKKEKNTTKIVAKKQKEVAKDKKTQVGVSDEKWGAAKKQDEETRKANIGKIEKISDEEYKTIQDYTGTHYGHINRRLEKGIVTDEAKIITKAIKKNRVKNDTVVVRKCGIGGLGALFGLERHEVTRERLQEFVGKIGVNKPFMSTTVSDDPQYGEDKPVEMHIYLPKGTQAAYIEDQSKFKGEKEALIQRGTKFLLRKVTGGYTVKVELEAVGCEV